MRLTYYVTPSDQGQRAVDILVRQAGISRLLSKKIRLYGHLTCNGSPHRMVDPVRAGDVLIADYEQAPNLSGALQPVPGVQVRFLDDWLLVVSKPAGMVTHPSYRHETGSLTGSLAECPLHPVTRLDRDTSGLVLIARNGHAHYVLASHPLQKQYLALVHGRLPARNGLINIPIRRSSQSIILREASLDGDESRTLWHELRYFPHHRISLVRFTLLTGRTHQIRVHSQACSCPLLGDELYGLAAAGTRPGPVNSAARAADGRIRRQALHAACLSFRHPLTGAALRITAPLPADFRCLLQELLRQERLT
jgi:23S rRNA pseudouridine1911/1915/1917 synthase